MEFPYTFVIFFAVIFISIELSKQFDCLPDGNPIPGVPRSASSDSPGSSHTPASSRSPVRSAAHNNTHIRARSRSPPRRHSSWFVLGFDPEDLRFIRLISNANPHRVFEIRKYTFPADKPINLRGTGNELLPMPTKERNVLSTSTGDVVAIFEQNNNLLRGIYTSTSTNERARMNMNDGSIVKLNDEEIVEIPIGRKNPILKNYKVVHVNEM